MRAFSILFPEHRPERWTRLASVLIGFAALTLLIAPLGGRLYSTAFSSVLLTIVLVSLIVAISLHVRFLLLARREHTQTAKALIATEREYKSVFDHALDGIVILDDRRVCLDANPAAVKLLGTSLEMLVGTSIDSFFPDNGGFTKSWGHLLRRAFEHGETRVLRGDSQVAFVEYTVKANFLPGRHVAVIRDVTRRKESEIALRDSEERFQQMARNIQEVFWMLDAKNMEVLYVNQAYEAITGRSCQSLRQYPKSYEELIHPEDRIRVLSRLGESVQTGQFDEEFRIITAHNATHWVWVRGFPVRDPSGIVRRLVGTAQDITRRKMAEEQMARNLDSAEAARAEAEAFRKTSLALTQDLSMDYVLDTLLQSLLDLIPCESAQVILVESESRLFLAREVENCKAKRRLPRSPSTWDATESKFLLEALRRPRSLLIRDTHEEAQWSRFKGFAHFGSWLCVPLVASERVLGFLSLGDTAAGTLTPEHLRLAQSLAIPAAVAIQNARLYEQADLFRVELEQRFADLKYSTETVGKKGDGQPS